MLTKKAPILIHDVNVSPYGKGYNGYVCMRLRNSQNKNNNKDEQGIGVQSSTWKLHTEVN